MPSFESESKKKKINFFSPFLFYKFTLTFTYFSSTYRAQQIISLEEDLHY